MLFDNQQLDQLAAQVEDELRTLAQPPSAFESKGGSRDDRPKTMPAKQRQTVETVTGESLESFWAKFKRAAQKDLCEKDGVLNQQWKKYGDLNKKDTLRSFAAILATMGFSGNALSMLVVAVVVITLHIGIKAVCDDS